MKKLALVLAMVFGATGVAIAADAPAAGANEPTKSEAKAPVKKHAVKKAKKKAAAKAEGAKTDTEKK